MPGIKNQHAVVLLLSLLCTGVAAGGEIILAPATDNIKRSNEAAASRNKARTYKSGNVQATPPSGDSVIIQLDAAPEIEEGVLLPRDDVIPSASRTKNQENFHDRIQAQDAQPTGNDAASADKQGARMRLEENRFKANQYMKGKPAPSLALPNNAGQVVTCEDTGNVSGRIGDDSMSGREIVVIRDGKQVKMRCK